MSLSRLGLVKTSLIDYPGEVAAVLFTAGCNLRCPFCHNPSLVEGAPPEDFLPIEEIISFLKRRSRVLGGVCITGGEPLMHEDLPDLVDQIRALDLKCKIDTNGTYPDRLRLLTPDYVALDLKTSPSKYDLLDPTTGGIQRDLFDVSSGSDNGVWPRIKQSAERLAEKSADTLTSPGMSVEFRTTVVPDLVTPKDIEEITDFLARTGDNLRYVLAGFRSGDTLDPAYSDKPPYPGSVLEEMRSVAIAKGLDCSIRWNGN